MREWESAGSCDMRHPNAGSRCQPRLAKRLTNAPGNRLSKGSVRPCPTSYIGGEGHRSGKAIESQILRRDATVLGADPASACSTSYESGRRDSRPGIHFQAFSGCAHSEELRDPSSRGDNFQSSAPRLRSARGSGRSCEWV